MSAGFVNGFFLGAPEGYGAEETQLQSLYGIDYQREHHPVLYNAGEISGFISSLGLQALGMQLISDWVNAGGFQATSNAINSALGHPNMAGELNLYARQAQLVGAALAGTGEAANEIAKSTKNTGDGFSQVESKVINEAESILRSAEFAKIKAAYESGKSVTVNIGGRIIQYEPNLPSSGMTMFGENGFYIGPEAFTISESELSKTILHELFRLSTSGSAGGVTLDLVKQETKAAFEFANKAIEELLK